MIEFREGEKWCRWNGTMMDPDTCEKMFGIEGEVYEEDGWIDDGCTIYTDKPIGEVLMMIGEKFEDPEEYDEVLSQGYGYKDHEWESKLAGHIMFRTDFIKNLQVKPYAAFKEQYPNYNGKLYNAFMDELDAYYETLRYHGEDE